jgi:transposase InsO family protein
LEQLEAKPRGRPVCEVTQEERAVVNEVLTETGPRLGLPTLRQCCHQTRPCILRYLLNTHRQAFAAAHRQIVESLHWQRSGAIWAIDHSEPPRAIDGYYKQILAIRDLASGKQLAWTPVQDTTAESALPVLEGLARTHGPPLVLKSDNGSAFISDAMRDWLARWQIVSLFSPPRMPRYNGACEAGIGAAKRRTEYLAARHARHLDWSANDLFAALQWANHETYPGGLAAGTPASRFAARHPITDAERTTFRCAVVQCEQKITSESCTADSELTDTLRSTYHRRAIRHVLVDLAYLVITRRSIPLQLNSPNCARIT